MILITGMHRSGTSYITQLLSLCGLSLGTSFNIMKKPASDNQNGHYENVGLLAINEKIFADTGSNYYKPPSPEQVKNCPTVKYISGFDKMFDGDIAKDPRTTIFIDHYIAQCTKLKHIVHCVRHPIAVANSLHKRDKFPLDFSFNLWAYYNQYFLAHVGHFPTSYVSYEKFMASPQSEIERLIAKIGKGHYTEEAQQLANLNLNNTKSLDTNIPEYTPQIETLYTDLLGRCSL